MGKSKKQILAYRYIPATQLDLINRWNICQAIARVMYRSERTQVDLEKLFNQERDKYERLLTINH